MQRERERERERDTHRAFLAAAARIWNGLPQHVTSTPLLPVFRSRLKTHLFTISYPSPCSDHLQCSHSDTCHFGYFNHSCYLLTYLLTHRETERNRNTTDCRSSVADSCCVLCWLMTLAHNWWTCIQSQHTLCQYTSLTHFTYLSHCYCQDTAKIVRPLWPLHGHNFDSI